MLKDYTKNMVYNKKKNGAWLSLVITLVVVSSLIAIGPAQAFVLGIYVHDGGLIVNKGESIPISGSLTFESPDQYLPIQEFRFFLYPENGGQQPGGSLICSFDAAGNKIGNCNGIEMVEVHVPDPLYGYGNQTATYNSQTFNFGYGYGVTDSVDYTIEIDSNLYNKGKFRADFAVYMGNNPQPERFKSDLVSFEIN